MKPQSYYGIPSAEDMPEEKRKLKVIDNVI